ncbi:Aste57867_9322 [Aphanomyces stellatus]|uniref:Aste57867_9322 protein n=1 Tax=Aphanomyces stellatus TaxID=120398 RepID=A0A485KMI1_9STRA|nr:hypothetical protein As57867_009286 [Aphanomyces stellatus]VFT86204.1 Aste57867_9322 [Aphanomyces stellatus]
MITFSGDLQSTLVFCKFGDTEIAASVANSSAVSCLTPSVSLPTVVPVTIVERTLFSKSSTEYVSTTLFAFEFAPTLTSIYPTSGSSFQKSFVELTGSWFSERSVVRLGNAFATCTIFTNSTCTIEIPPNAVEIQGGGAVPVDISNNNQDYTLTNLIYFYAPRAAVLGIHPTTIRSSTLLSITGKYFSQTFPSTLCCRVNEHVILANYISPSQIQCLVPSLPAGLYVLEVSVNGQDYSNDKVEFTVQDPIEIYSIQPSFGSMQGQTLVQLTTNSLLSNFSSDTYCSFGGQVSPLNILNGSSGTCLSPPSGNAGYVTLDIVQSSVPYSIVTPTSYYVSVTSLKSTYSYITPLQVTSIFPSRGFQHGGTIVSILGTNFVNSGQAACVFGNVSVPAVVVSPMSMRCVTPELPPSSPVSVAVTANGVDIVQTNMLYYLVPDIKLMNMTPNRSTLAGGGIVEVYGTGFRAANNLSCIFGAAAPVPAVVKSSAALECLVPPYSRETTVVFTIAMNQHDWSPSGLSFSYQQSAILYSVSPLVGPHSGNTPLIVVGEGFTSNMTCQFGDVMTNITLVTSRKIQCNSPPVSMDVDFVLFQVNDPLLATGQTNPLPFYFVDLPPIIEVQPKSGPMIGQTQVVLTLGSDMGFYQTVFCKFCDAIVPGVFGDAVHVTCLPLAQRYPGNCPLTISVNGIDFSGPIWNYTFYKSPTLTSLFPSRGQSGTQISVYGDSFVNSTYGQCKIGVSAVPATFLSSSELLCVAPLTNSVQNEIQQITLSGPTPQPTIQTVTTTAMPAANEVQVVTTSAWANGPQIQTITSSISPVQSNTVEITTFSNYQPEVQWLVFQVNPQMPEVQTITTTGTASGFFTVEVLGFNVNVGYQDSALTVQQSLQTAAAGHSFSVTRSGIVSNGYTWFVTFDSDVGAMPMIQLVSSTSLGGTSPTVAFARSRLGTVKDVQTISLYGTWFTGTGITMDILFNGNVVVSGVAIPISASALATALNAAGNLGTVSVTGSYNTYLSYTGSTNELFQFDITMQSRGALESLLQIRFNSYRGYSAVVHKISATTPAPAGTFTLSLGTSTTPALNYNISPYNLKVALQGLVGVNVAMVQELQAASYPTNLRTLAMTFSPLSGDIATLVVQTASPTNTGLYGDTSSTLSTGLSASILPLANGMYLSGAFKVSHPITGALMSAATNIQCGSLTTLLGATSCAVVGPGINGEYKWTLSLASVVVPITVSNVGMVGANPQVQVTKFTPASVAKIQAIALSNTHVTDIHRVQVVGVGALWEVQSIAILAQSAIQGVFSIQYGSETTGNFTASATAQDIQNEFSRFRWLNGVAVSRQSTTNGTFAGFTWLITFYTPGDIAALQLQTSNLVGVGLTTQVTEVVKGIPCEIQQVVLAIPDRTVVSGTFTLSFGGAITANLPYAATVAQVQTALQLTLNAAVNVSLVTPNPEGGSTWAITFPMHAGNIPVLAVDASNLASTPNTAPATIRVQVVQQGMTQPLYGSFIVGFQGQMATVSLPTTTSALATALNGIIPGGVTVNTGLVDHTGGGIWDVTFTSLGVQPLMTFNLASVRGTLATATDTRLRTGTQYDLQVVTTTAATSGTFFLAYGNLETANLAYNALDTDVQSAINGLLTTGTVTVTRTSSGTNSYSWTVTFQEPNSIPLVAGGVNLVGQIMATRLMPSPLTPVQGTFSISYMSKSVVVAANTSALQMASFISSLPNVGSVAVTRTGDALLNAFVWTITYLQNAGTQGTLAVASNSLTSTGQVGIASTVIQEGTATCCLAGTFRVAFGPTTRALPGTLSVEQNWPIVTTSQDLTQFLGRGELVQINGYSFTVDLFLPFDATRLPLSAPYPNVNNPAAVGYTQYTTPWLDVTTTTAQAFTNALGTIPSMTSVQVSRSPKPVNNGYSWSVTFVGATTTDPPLLRVTSALSLGTLSASITTPRTQGEVRMIYVSATSTISGTFSFSIGGVSAPALAWNASARDMKASLETLYKTVNVTRTPLFTTNYNYLGDGYGWFVTFASDTGTARTLVFNAANLATKYSATAVANWMLVTPGTSTSLGGTFQLSYLGYTTTSLAYNEVPANVQSALNVLPSIAAVAVTRSGPDPNQGYSWSITFLPNPSKPNAQQRGNFEPLMPVSSLTGTAASVAVVEQVAGSFLDGTYLLKFGAQTTALLAYNAPADVVQDALQLFQWIGSVAVSRSVVNAAGGYTYSITFATTPGQVNILAHDDTQLLGTQAQVVVQVIQAGVNPITGTFAVSFNGSTTGSLAYNILPADLQVALEALPSIGTVAVSQSTSLNSYAWQVTFLATGDPPNLGNLPLMTLDSLNLHGTSVQPLVTELQAGCCSVQVALNGQDWTSDVLSFRYEASMTVQRVSPSSGPLTGGTVLTLHGTNFVNASMECLFGTVTTAVSYVNASVVTCVAPPQGMAQALFVAIQWAPYGLVSVIHTVADSQAMFQYYAPVELTSLTPAFGSLDGTTYLRITGSNFINSTALACAYVSYVLAVDRQLVQTVAARFVSSTEIGCKAPTLTSMFPASASTWTNSVSATTSISISNNGVDFTTHPSNFTSLPAFQASAITPSSGPLGGGTVATVQLAPVQCNPNVVRCRFGNHTPVLVSSCQANQITCRTPSHRPEPAIYTLQVTSSSLVGEIQTITTTSPSSIISGFFRLGLQGYSTSLLSSSVSTTSMQNALNQNIPLLNVVAVTRTANAVGYTWSITFALESGNIGPLEPDSSMLEGPGATVLVATIQNGPMGTIQHEIQQIQFSQPVLANEVQLVTLAWSPLVVDTQRISLTSSVVISGTFTVSYNGIASAALPFNADAPTVQGALQAIAGVGSVAVTQTHATNTRGYTWDVTFLNAIGARPTLTASNANLSPVASATLTVTKLFVGTSPVNGTFALSYLTFATPSLAYNIDAATLQSYLNTLLPAAVPIVTKEFRATSTIWRITFGLVNFALAQLTVTSPSLVGSGVSVTTSRATTGGILLGGSFKVVYNGVPTVATIPLSSTTPTALAAALAPLTPAFTLTSASTALSYQYTLAFVATAGNVPPLALDVSLLTGTSVSANVTTLINGTYAPLSGTFQLGLNTAATPAMAFNAPGATVATAIQALPNVGAVAVSPIAALANGFQWQVTFQDTWRASYAANLHAIVPQTSLLGGTNASVGFWPLVDTYGLQLPLFVTTNGQDYVDTHLVFTYHEMIVVDSLDPLNGPTSGGTIVTVILAAQSMAFGLLQSVSCRFDAQVVAGVVVTSNQIQCPSPAHATAGAVAVDISANGVDFSDSGVTFSYRLPLNLQSISPTRGPVAGGTLIAVAMAAINLLDVYACKIGGQVIQAEQTNATHVLCRTPSMASPGAVAVEITCNHQVFTSSDIQFTYVNPLYLTSITPAWGAATGGNTVRIRGGVFDQSQPTQCRFGEKIVDALVLSNDYVSCAPPRFDPIGQVQTISTTASGYVPDVQDVVVSAAPDQPLVLLVETSGNVPSIETHVVSITGQTTPEVQVIQPTVDTLSLEIRTVSTRMTPTITEVKTIALTATPIHEVQQINVYVNTAALAAAQLEVQAISLPIAATEPGTFGVQFRGVQTPPLPYATCTLAQLQSALEALDTIGSLRVTLATQSNTRVWSITFLDNTGPLPLLVIDTSALTVVAPASIQVMSIQHATTIGLGGAFAVSYNGQTSADIPVRASASDVASVIQALPNVQNPIVVTRTDLDCNGGATWTITFLSTPTANGNLPVMVLQTARLTGTAVVGSVTPVTDANTIAGNFQLGFQGSLTATLYPTTTETAMASAVQTLTQVPVVGVTKVGPTSVNGYSWHVTFGGAPAWIPDLVGVSALSGVGAAVVTSTTRVAQVSEVQQLTLSATSLIGGTFVLQMGGQQTTTLPSDVSALDMRTALNALANVGSFVVSKGATDGVGGCAWQITFATLAGPQNLLQVVTTDPFGRPSLFDFGTRDLSLVMTRVQQGVGSAIAGVFQVAVNGQLSSAIPFDATAAEMQQALQTIEPVQVSTTGVFGLNNIMDWTITFLTPLAAPRQLTATTSTLTPGSSIVQFGTLQAGLIQEVRQIVTSQSTGSFVCTFATVASGAIPFNANAASVLTALSVLPAMGALQVSGSNPWLITFTQLTSPIPTLTCGAGQTVTVVQTSTATALAGTFRLGFNNLWSINVAPNAPAATVQSALNTLLGVGSVTVTQSANVINNGQQWTVTFINMPGSQPLLVVDASLLTGTNAQVHVTRQVEGSHVTGTFGLAVNGGATGPLSPQITAADMTTALQSVLRCASCVSVTRSTPLGAGGFAWTIQFLPFDPSSQTFLPQIQIPFNQLSVVAASSLNCTGLVVSVSNPTNGSASIGGAFVLRYRDQPTVPIPWDATPETLLLAIQHIRSIPNATFFRVTRAGPFVTGGMQWRVTFPFNVPYPLEVFRATSFLTGAGTPTVAVSILAGQTIPFQGTFVLQASTARTAPIAFNANGAVMATALNALATIGGVTVTTFHVPAMNQYKWRVSFTSLVNAGPQALLTVPTFLVTGTSAQSYVTKVVTGSQNQLQVVTIAHASLTPTGTFNLVFNGYTSPTALSASCSAAELQAVLQAVPGIGATRVERIAAANGLVGFTWYILLLQLTQAVTRVVVPTTSLLPTLNLVATVAVVNPTTVSLAGSFAVQYGAACVDGTDLASSACVPASTPPLPYNVDAPTLQLALSLLPGLQAVVVTRTGPDYLNGYVWSVSFPTLLGQLALLTTTSSLLGTNASVAVAVATAGVTFDDAKVAVAVTQNGQDYTLGSTVVYRYMPTILVMGVSPTHGPVAGGTELVVRGAAFTNSSQLYCRFGGTSWPLVVVAATYLNATALTCLTPRTTSPGPVVVDVSTNGRGTTQSTFSNTTTAVFTYDALVTVSSVTPSLGPATGNFSVVVVGGPFPPTPELRCRFGQWVVQGVWLKYDAMRCVAPTQPVGTVALEVSINNQDYTAHRVPFYYYPNPTLHRIDPVFGPATAAGTVVNVYGAGKDVVPAVYMSPSRMLCAVPALDPYSSGLQPMPLSEQRNTNPDPSTGSLLLFPMARHFPLVQGRLVSVEISNNQQDFTFTGINFMYYQDPTVVAITPTRLYASSTVGLLVQGAAFLNTTHLACRVGVSTVPGLFVAPTLVLCHIHTTHVKASTPTTLNHPNELVSTSLEPHLVFVEVANNGVDFTTNRVTLEFLGLCPSGFYCPVAYQGQKLPCPRGTYCPGTGNSNYTLCPRGTYQSLLMQSACLRCPIGYHCPQRGLHVPRICPAGFVCDVTGTEMADQPCPQGHFCLEGTATTATQCGHRIASRKMGVTYSHGERGGTVRKGRAAHPSLPSLGSRHAGCWDNSTQDFGLQLSPLPTRFWQELQQMPLSDAMDMFVPIRGRYCMDDACLRVDSPIVAFDNPLLDYQSHFALRRPVPCPPGMYCHVGTAGNASVLKNFTSPQPCFESMYCPEGSGRPDGQGDCPAGFYCPFGIKLPCPAGTYCPLPGSFDPLSCPPGTFNAMVGQTQCATCPEGYICPGFNRIQPVLCPAGFVCSKPQLASPNLQCPPGYYCVAGRLTSDPFRNDTTLRPYPCKAGTYCLGGVVSDDVVAGNYNFAQNCTVGFYCEIASFSPKGIGMCPPGFYCPAGTAVPIPTPKGSFAALNGTVQAALCPPSYYAPTIESTTCYPCPPGTTCPQDGTAVATICAPGTFRSTVDADGIACVPCPQGTWSKNWGLREVGECTLCPPGTVCATNGMTNPCSTTDFPLPYTPTRLNESVSQCLARGSHFYFGVLLEPWIDGDGIGPHFMSHISGQCYFNPQPLGSPLYQRFTEYFGPLADIATGEPHQGYGNLDQLPGPGYFDRGSLYVDLTHSTRFNLERNCTRGFFHNGAWFPGTCEADTICFSSLTAQALICPDGYICDEETTDALALAMPCAPGYVCGYGTTPDVYLESPMGQYKMLCPRRFFCGPATGVGQMTRNTCPTNYFCPTGTVDPYMGLIANDAERRGISATDAHPFLDVTHVVYLREGDVRQLSLHDARCLYGIDPELLNTYSFDAQGGVVDAAIEYNLLCARDNKWRHVFNAIARGECDCVHQVDITLDLFQLWQCQQLPCTLSQMTWRAARASIAGIQFPRYSTTIYATYAALAAAVTNDMAQYLAPHTILKGQTYTLQAPDELYDLYTAVTHVTTYQADLPLWVNFVPNSHDILRLDMCDCQRLFKCPNGTVSPSGSDSIFACVKAGYVLQRRDLIPFNHSRQVNGSGYTALSGTNDPISHIILNPLEVAIVTIDATQLDRNMTYGDHYQISIYKNCKPCPPEYQCSPYSDPPGCTYPNDNNATGQHLYDACVASTHDPSMCDANPFFCEVQGRLQADGSLLKVPGCCSCERLDMAVFFDSNTPVIGYPDDKHGMIEFTISAVAQTQLTIVVELLHGLYYNGFAAAFAATNIEFDIFTPSRARYTPQVPTTDSFMTVLVQDDFAGMALPLNLPMSNVRVPKTTSFHSQMETAVFVDRIADILVGAPAYAATHNLTRISDLQAHLGATPANTSQIMWNDMFGSTIVADPTAAVQFTDVWWDNVQTDGLSNIMLPYLPFFSACAGYDSHTWLSKLLESHPDCTFVDYDATHYVDELLWHKMTQPLSDACLLYDGQGIELQCMFEENLAGGSDKPRWYESATGTTLFHLTKYPMPAHEFIGNASVDNPIYWGQTQTVENMIGTTNLITVAVGPNSNGYPLVVPKTVTLTINYYQQLKGYKIFVNAQVDFNDQCVISTVDQDIQNAATNGIYPCETNIVTGAILSNTYMLNVIFQALSWFELLNQFQFSIQVYFLLFSAIGLGSIVQGYMIYLVNRLFTKMRHPPPFRLVHFIKTIAPQPATATIYLSIPLIGCTMIIYTWWNVLKSTTPAVNPNVLSFEQISGDWLYISALDDTHVKMYKAGRLGTSIVTMGVFMVLLGAKLMIPDHMDQQKEDNIMNQAALESAPTDPFAMPIEKTDEGQGEQDEGDEAAEFWNPLLWKRMNFILVTVMTAVSLLFVFEFSYSATFTSNCFNYLLLYKVVEHVYDNVFDAFVGEALLSTPLSVVVGMTEGLITMSAPDFFGFVMGFIMMQAMMMLDRLFLGPFLAWCSAMMPKWKMQFHRMFRKKRRRTRDQKAAEEAEWRKVCHEIEEKANGIEAILDSFAGYAGETAALYASPLAMAFLYLFAPETQIPALYSILETDLFYYILFAVVTLPFAMVLDTVLWNTQELIHGWKAFEYGTYQRHRFSIRKERWQLNMKIMDKSIAEEFQAVDLLCFSSQYYFLILLYTSGVLYLIFGFSIWIRQSYNPFGDRMLFIIVALVFLLCLGCMRLCIYVGNKLKIWVPKALRGTIDDEIAAKLALGAGRQQDLEMERMEMQALNSERFRHRFLEKNRPWILQHMVELFTPRTLQLPGPLGDGKPAVEYVRDIYNELMNMGEGRRLKGDRSDISSDDEDELFKQRQNWSNVPVEGTTKDLALYWLAKARKRRLFGKFVAGIILQHKGDTCHVCQKTEAGGYTMSVDIATPDGKEMDKTGLDKLIKGFEEQYSETETDADLWKAYFRQHATFITMCNVCVSVLEQKRMARLVQPIGQQTKTRAEDLSSDEDGDGGDDVVFEAMVVSRTSAEGRVMSKWLQAARKRLGGVFPRDNARAEMEAYAERMRAKKARKTKKKRVDSDDEDPSVHWKVNLTEASRALLLRWVWQAREDQYRVFRDKGEKLRKQVEDVGAKMHEVDDWFFSKEMRMQGVELNETARKLLEDQLALEHDIDVKKRAVTQEVESYVVEKRDAMTKETDAFNNLIESDRAVLKTKLAAREAELLEEKKRKEVEFLEIQKQARVDNGGKVPPMLMQEHRAYLAKMDEDRRKEREDAEAVAGEKENQKQDAFNRKLALSESGIINRQALTAHRMLALRKDMMNTLRQQEKSWQNKAMTWLEKATRKVAVKEQEDAENALAAKKRKKVV